MRLSVTARIALLSIVLALASNLAVILFVWKQTHDTAMSSVRSAVVEQSDELAEVYRTGGAAALTEAIADARASDDETLVLALLAPDGRRLTGDAPPRLDAVPLATVRFQVARIATTQPWSEHSAGYALRRVGNGWLLNGRLLAVIEEEQRALERALAVAVLVSLALGVIAGLVVSRYVAGRLVRIAGVIETVGEGDLSARVPVVADDGGGDAFDRLSQRLNAMLEKVERLMTELRVVTDGLAHDLRSPLARLRTKTENALLMPDAAQRETALGGLLIETDFVMRMLTTVIEISRAEQVTRDRFTRVDPAELVEELGELYQPLAEDADITFVVALDDRPPPMALHRELLSQAISNLIDNALKHGAAGSDVTLRITETAGEVAIQVEDRGPGIPAEDRARAMKKFGRLDSARSTPGAGLGMALVEAVARLHNGRFELGDNAPGLVARIVLPR